MSKEIWLSVDEVSHLSEETKSCFASNKYIASIINVTANRVSKIISSLKEKEYRKVKELLKDAASPLKMSWLYINRITLFIVVLIASILIMIYLHKLQVDYIYTEPTSEYDLITTMGDSDEEAAMEITRIDNKFLDMFRGNLKTTQDDILKAMQRSAEYEGATEEKLQTDSERIYEKLQTINLHCHSCKKKVSRDL